MSVASISSWKIGPGRRGKFIDLLATARRFHERHGGNVRSSNNSVAADSADIVEYWIEHDDFQAYRRFPQPLAEDAVYKPWSGEITGPNGTAHVIGARHLRSVE